MTKFCATINDLSPLINLAIEQNKQIDIPINGVSMSPMLRPNSSSVTLARADNVAVNDVLLYHLPSGQYVLHRLIRLDETTFDTLGDGELLPQKGIPRECIVAKVTAFSRDGKTHAVDEKKYLRYVSRWNALRPVRKILLFVDRVVRKMKIGKK
ncbi:MAG: hypothetical protein RSB10_02915 [Clostridia bacterium]